MILRQVFLRVTGVFLVLLVVTALGGCTRADDTANMTELQRLKSGSLEVVLLSHNEALRKGKDTFTIEFRSSQDGKLVNVGTVRASANMSMPGMTMFGKMEVQPTNVPGRYTVNSDFGMVGTWQMTVDWDGPVGRGSISFAGSVQ